MLICAVCGDRFPFHEVCYQVHNDVCHWCASLNLQTPLDHPAHDAPPTAPARRALEPWRGEEAP